MVPGISVSLGRSEASERGLKAGLLSVRSDVLLKGHEGALEADALVSWNCAFCQVGRGCARGPRRGWELSGSSGLLSALLLEAVVHCVTGPLAIGAGGTGTGRRAIRLFASAVTVSTMDSGGGQRCQLVFNYLVELCLSIKLRVDR